MKRLGLVLGLVILITGAAYALSLYRSAASPPFSELILPFGEGYTLGREGLVSATSASHPLSGFGELMGYREVYHVFGGFWDGQEGSIAMQYLYRYESGAQASDAARRVTELLARDWAAQPAPVEAEGVTALTLRGSEEDNLIRWALTTRGDVLSILVVDATDTNADAGLQFERLAQEMAVP